MNSPTFLVKKEKTKTSQLEDNDTKEDVTLEDVVRRQGEVEEKQVKNVENQSHIRASHRRVTMDSSRKYVKLLDRILDLDKKVEDLSARIGGKELMESKEEDSSPHVLCDAVTTYQELHDLEEGESTKGMRNLPGEQAFTTGSPF